MYVRVALIVARVVAATAVLETSTTATTTSATSTAATAPPAATASTEAALLVLVTAALPVVLVAAVGATATSATVRLAGLATLALPELPRRRAGLHLTASNHAALLGDIGALGHDLQLVAVVLGLGLDSQEGLGALLGLELDKHRALEKILIRATETDGRDIAAVLGEEILEVELGLGGFVTETLDVDSALGNVVLIDGEFVGLLALDLLLALLADNLEDAALLERAHKRRVVRVASHALEVVNVLDVNGLVLGTTSEVPEVLI